MRTVDLETLCFVVMPDHVHWLVVLGGRLTLSEIVRSVKGRSARQINVSLNRTGKLWQAGFHDRVIRHEDSLLEVARYVVANPIRAGLCEQIEDYPHWDCIWITDRG